MIMECDETLSFIFVVIKNVMLLINIICPILLMIGLGKNFIFLMSHPEDKKGLAKLKNSIVAFLLVFFIPLILNVTISWYDNTYNFSLCIESAKYEGGDTEYLEVNDEKKKNFIIPSSEYDEPIISNKHKIAELAVALSPTAEPSGHLSEPNANPWNKINDSRLNNFYEVMDLTIGKYGDNNAYGSCAQAAGGVIRATADPDFNVANPEGQMRYLKNNPKKWKYVGIVKAGERFDEKCKPGDLLVCESHTMIYVGNEMARKKFPNTRGNMFQAGYVENSHAKYPSIDLVETEYRDFYIYRSTGEGDYQKLFISIDKYLDY